jgi:hypothetical protein
MNLLVALFAPFIALGTMLGGFFVDEQLGASEAVPVTIAFFETTLQDAITSSATSFTLTSATDKDGTTLASSTYAFVIDEGSANEEIVIADCTGTACTNALRGVSARTGNTEVAALKKAHRRGASIKITDAPILMLATRALRGEAIVNFTPDEARDLVTKDYVDSLALGTTTVAATTLDDGIVELATGTEAASSTATGNSGSPLTLHTRISTSTPPSSGSYVVVTGADGNIADGFLASTSVTQYAVWKASTTIYAATSTHNATSTYTKPSGLKFIVVEIVGGGAGGSGSDTDSSPGVGNGGSSGAYVRKIYSASALSASTVVVAGASGSGGTSGADPTVGGAGGDSKFGSLFAGGGLAPGAYGRSNIGGTATGGDININGAPPEHADADAVGASRAASNPLGVGGLSYIDTSGNWVAFTPTGYGAGGAPSYEYSAGSTVGPTVGGYGVVIITEYF